VSNDVHAIAIDCVGNKWFGTTDGISKFDGISWTTYTTANSYLVKYDVSTIAVDDVCNVWIGTSRDGVSKFDGSNWTFYTEIDGLASNYVRAIAHDESGSVWFGSAGSFWRTVCQYSPTWQCRVDWVNGGMSKFDGSRWTTYTMGPAANGVFAATIDTARHQWFGTEGGISHFDGTDWTIYNTINSGLVDDNVQAIAIDGAGEIWIGSVQHMNPCDTRSYIGGGISRFDGNDWATYATNLSVYAIAIDDADNKWFGTAGGVRKFNGNNWTAYTATNSGLVSNYVFAIAIDNTGNKWFGTYAGVSKFDGTNWTAYTTGNSGLVSNSVRAITIDDAGNKWFGTDAGVSKFDGTNWSTYTTGNSGLVNNYVRAIAIDPAGSIWFGSGQWLGGHSSALIVYYRSYSGFLIKEVCTLFTDNGVKGGVSQFDGSTWITYTTANSGLANNYVPAIAIDGVDKWFGTWGGGVSILRTSEPLGNRSYLPIIAK
jgi:hypothetical protein